MLKNRTFTLKGDVFGLLVFICIIVFISWQSGSMKEPITTSNIIGFFFSALFAFASIFLFIESTSLIVSPEEEKIAAPYMRQAKIDALRAFGWWILALIPLGVVAHYWGMRVTFIGSIVYLIFSPVGVVIFCLAAFVLFLANRNHKQRTE